MPVILDRFGPENATDIVGLFTEVEATTAFGAPVGMNQLVVAMGWYAVIPVVLAVLTLAGSFHWGLTPVGVA